MTDAGNDEDGIIELWPTKFVRRRLADHEARDKQLVKLIREQEKANKDLTTDYLAPDLFNIDQPAVNWLRTEVNATVIRYLRAIGIAYPVNWQIVGWPNVNRFGDYHDAHNHPWSYLSGTNYVKVPTAREPLRTSTTSCIRT